MVYKIKATVTKNWQSPAKVELTSKRKMTEAQFEKMFAKPQTMYGTNDTVKNKVTIKNFACRKVA